MTLGTRTVAAAFDSNMGEVKRVEASGPLPGFSIGISSCSGEVLWPVGPFFNHIFGNTSRQALKVLDKSDKSIRSLHQELLGVMAPPKLAATRFVSIQCFHVAV